MVVPTCILSYIKSGTWEREGHGEGEGDSELYKEWDLGKGDCEMNWERGIGGDREGTRLKGEVKLKFLSVETMNVFHK